MKLFKFWTWLFPVSFYQPGVAAAMVGAAVVGGVASNSAAKKGAKAQTAAADSANATQLQMYNQGRQDQLPAMERGNMAGDRLSLLLGLDTQPTYGNAAGGNSYSQDNFDENAYLAANPDVADPTRWDPRYHSAYDHWVEYGKNEGRAFTPLRPIMTGQEAIAANKSNPLYGSLSKNFTEQDFWDDPVTKLGFQFGLDEGTKGVNRMAAAGGSLDSGKTLKELTRYATDYTGTKAGDSFNRFNTNQTNQFNRLASLAGVGQTAANQISSQGVATGQGIAQNQIGIGNARAASAIGSANALTGAVGQGMNWWQQNQMMNQQQPQQNYLSNYNPQYAGQGNSGGWTSGYDL